VTISRTTSRLRPALGLVAAATIAMVLHPVVSVVLRAFAEDEIGGAFTLRWAAAVFAPGRNLDALFNTLVYTAGSSALAMTIGVGLAVLSVRTDMPGGRVIGVLSLMPILVPPFILVVGWVAIADPNAGFLNILGSLAVGSRIVLFDVNTMAGIIWVTGLFLAPYVYLLTAAALTSGDPAAEEAARVAGAGRTKLLLTIILPLLRPTLVAALLLVVIMSAGDFIIPSTIGLKARIYLVSSLIWQNSNTFPPRAGLAAAQGLLLIAVGLTCIYLQRRALARGGRYTLTGGKGARAMPIKLGRARYAFAALAVLFALLSSVVPLAAVLSMAFMRFWAPYAFVPANFTLRNFEYILFEYPQVWPSAANSLVLAVAGASVCVALAIALAWYTIRLRAGLTRAVEYAVVLPLGIPGIALGLGLLNAWILVPGGIYGTMWILLLAYVIAHIPVAMQFVGSALHAIHTDLEDASRVAGRSWLDTVRLVDVPLMRPALLGCWLLIYVVILREISLVILLYNPSTVVLSVGLMDVWGSGFYPELAVYSLLLLALGLVPVAALWRWAKFGAT
jgi:iron(III) transport system permease protein